MDIKQNGEKKGAVISLFEERVNKKKEVSVIAASSDEFLDIMKKNDERLQRMRSERLKANESVLKSYRIKN